ncbi:hypothetical protein QLQ80_00680 [Mycoplasma sp. M5725]|uniref:Uncharacterized protein n=1 Tax=Mycoplasma phocimorsus TaxID=3045839 RepID=A0AAJ1PTK9_9MOLU|nr:hypothetical protein [Mycoplasma phocimorsus]MDJ1645606.1 hypothetical protein [Mycoplasma phocimorsus]MDJ1646118.1 hypothetical protein [Mycoplasma phocimorsus]
MIANYAVVEKVEKSPELVEEFTGRIDSKGMDKNEYFNIEINPKTREFYIDMLIIDRYKKIVDHNFGIKVFINRTKTFEEQNIKLKQHDSLEGWGTYRITQDKLDFNKWDKVSELVVQIYDLESNNKKERSSFSVINESRMNNYKKDFQIDTTHELKVKVIKTIKIYLYYFMDYYSYPTKDFGYSVVNIAPSFSIENALTNNTEWFSIYTNNENSNSFLKYKLLTKPNMLTNFLINSELANLKDMTQRISAENWIEIGSYKSTKYDYNLKTTVETLDGKNGYIIPYSFSGALTPTLNFDVDIFKNINVYYKIKIDKPLLDKYNGIIKLKTTENNDIKNPNFLNNLYEIQKKEIDAITNNRITMNCLKQKSIFIEKSLISFESSMKNDSKIILEEKKNDKE